MSIRKPDRSEALTTFAGNAYSTDSDADATPSPSERLKALKHIRQVAAAVAARRLTRPAASAPRPAAAKAR